MKPDYLYNQVAILGVGLLGASFGLALKEKKLAGKILGFGRSQSSLRIAQNKKAIDTFSTDLKKAVSQADLIILATPAKVTLKLLPKVFELASKAKLIIDLASTKKQIIELAQKSKAPFIGTHPMAGFEKSGPRFATADLYQNALCFVVPPKNAAPKKVSEAKSLLKKIGLKTLIFEAKKHDELLSLVSHLPQIVAYSLWQTVFSKTKKLTGKNPETFCGNGLKDMTRLAASDPQMWVDILATNAKNIEKFLDQLIGSLNDFRKLIKTLEKNNNEKRKLKAQNQLEKILLEIQQSKKNSA